MKQGNRIVARQVSYDGSNKDFYSTPRPATLALLDKVQLAPTILEPASGNGAISKVLEEFGHGVISQDLRTDEGVYGKKGVDFFSIPDKIVAEDMATNPPFRYAREFVEKGLKVVERRVCLLLRLVFLESQGRHAFFYNTPLYGVYVFSQRISLYPDGYENRGGGTAAYAWFVWDKYEATNHYPIIDWIDLRKYEDND